MLKSAEFRKQEEMLQKSQQEKSMITLVSLNKQQNNK